MGTGMPNNRFVCCAAGLEAGLNRFWQECEAGKVQRQYSGDLEREQDFHAEVSTEMPEGLEVARGGGASANFVFFKRWFPRLGPVLKETSTTTMNWDDDNAEVIYLSSSTSSPRPSRRHSLKKAPSSSSEVVVLTDTEDDGGGGRRSKWPSPVRHALSDAQFNLPAAPGLSVRVDPFIAYSARVLEIIPDVEPTYLRTLLEQHYPACGEGVVQNVLHILFEDTSYPRVEKVAGKRKRAPDDDDGREKSKLKLDYASKDRKFLGGQDYTDLTISQLLQDFPLIPKPHIRATLRAHRGLYAPTHLFLAKEAISDSLPYIKKTIPSRLTGKSRQWHDPEFDKERAWLVEYLVQKDKTTVEPDTMDDNDDDECEDGIECGCCFSKFVFDKMVQCSEAHLFCRSCCRSYAANQLGQHDHRLRCMDQSGCKELFPESELVRFLPETLLGLYHRLKQQKEIAAAGLEGLEECPFCEYKVVIENADEKLFRCESADCGVVSCRSCKKPDHLPKSCKEVQNDQHLSIRHVIEEAMTKALMRNCPKCNKGFVKENGCNKMTCPNCRTLSCYICRQVITGYDHFGQPPPYTGPPDPNKCNLWDHVEQRHNNEVIAAAKKAIEEYKTAHPDIADEALNVDLPAPIVNLPQPMVQAAQLQAAHMHMQAARLQAAHAALAAGMPQVAAFPGVRQPWNAQHRMRMVLPPLGPPPGQRRRRR